jgi:hypothetical protein
MIHRSSGLFDPLSKHKSSSPGKPASFDQASAQSTGVESANGNGSCDMNGSCFGLCGPECITPGNISTPACFGHDYCVCAYSHAQCLFSPPAGCGLAQSQQCASLFEAAGSWLGGMWDSFWEATAALLNEISLLMEAIGDFLGELWDSFWDGLSDLLDEIFPDDPCEFGGAEYGGC